MARHVIIEAHERGDERRYWVATLEVAAGPLTARVDRYRMRHEEAISLEDAESAVIDLNRGGSGMGPGKMPG
jgi:hypothetical protein